MTSSGHVYSNSQRYDIACRVTRERALNVAENVGVPFLYAAYRWGEWFWIDLISNGKMKTRHPTECYFGSEFRAICNHCWVMAAWIFVEDFLRLFCKQPLAIKFLKFCSKPFHRFTDHCCCVEISWNLCDGKSAKSCVIYWTKKLNFACLSNYCCGADRAQNLPGPTSNSVLRVLQISSKSVHFRQSYSRMREHRPKLPSNVNPIFAQSKASRRIKTG